MTRVELAEITARVLRRYYKKIKHGRLFRREVNEAASRLALGIGSVCDLEMVNEATQ
jgi:hypothetical protein